MIDKPEKPKRAVQWFVVPEGTPIATCKSCPFTIYYILTAAGKQMPVDCGTDGGRIPTATTQGRGVSHFATCAGAAQHRRAR